jgi:thiamine biosynthesis protein ThiS
MTHTTEGEPVPADPVSVVLNGDERRVPGGRTASDLLTYLGLRPGMVVVELNREILRGDEIERTEVKEGDRIELVHFVGGG